MAGLMKPDGSLRGAESINDYYKSAFGLAAAGLNSETDTMLDYINKTFLTADGDLIGDGCPWFDVFRIYPHTWILMAAILRARFDIAERIAGFLDAFQDPSTGGYYGTLPAREKEGQQEMMTTGLSGIAMLWAGRREAALKTGQWMKNVMDAQPDITEGLDFVWHHDKGLVTEFPEEERKSYRVNPQEPGQRYYNYGIPAAFLTCLHGQTGDRQWLDLAGRYLHATEHCRDDFHRSPQSGKVGWGAAWLYRITGDPAARAIVERVYGHLASVQHAEGWWDAMNVYEQSAETSPEPGIDITGEFMAHLSWMESVL
jgi:hypothetical protein